MTSQAETLQLALQSRGVIVKTEHFDKHKHVDLYLPEAKIYIEVDGLQHLTEPKQIIADFNREHYSDMEGFDTLHVTNGIVMHHLDEIADAIAEVVKERKVLRLLEDVQLKQTIDKPIFKDLT